MLLGTVRGNLRRKLGGEDARPEFGPDDVFSHEEGGQGEVVPDRTPEEVGEIVCIPVEESAPTRGKYCASLRVSTTFPSGVSSLTS